MSERRQAAWDEAQRRYPTGDRQAGFVAGAAWADAHQYSTPEDLVAAYEEGQRDAVSKGLANPQPITVTTHDMGRAYAAFMDADGHPVRRLIVALKAIGIEVRDE